MAIAPPGQTRRIGNLHLLMPPQGRPTSPLAACLELVRSQWRQEGNLAALWQAWPRIAGEALAPHCRPLNLSNGILTVGASHPQWLQGLQYNRHQLLGALRGAGFSVRDLRFRQVMPLAEATPDSELEATVWASHPSRVDVHGMGECPCCRRPAPGGEIQRWGHCSFCQRQNEPAPSGLAQ